MKKFLFFLFICLLPSILFAQRGYYSIDSTTYTGIKMIDGGNLNFKSCQIRKGEKKIQYSPDQIKSYGFNDRRFYKAFSIDVNGRQERYFLQLLIPGKVNLYYAVIEGEKKYFLTDSIRLNPMEIPQILNNNRMPADKILADCPQSIKNIPHVRTRRNDLIRFIKDYNRCADRPLLRTRYGFELGATSYNLIAVNYPWAYPIPGHMNSSCFYFGAFADIPFWTINLSFHPELNFEYLADSKSFNEEDKYDLVLNSSSVSIPVYLRYTVLKNFLSPFFQIGPVYSRSIRNNSKLYQYKTVNNNIFISIPEPQVLQNDLAGFSIGTGVISNYGSKYSCFGELNYTTVYNLRHQNNLLRRNEFTIKFGILF